MSGIFQFLRNFVYLDLKGVIAIKAFGCIGNREGVEAFTSFSIVGWGLGNIDLMIRWNAAHYQKILLFAAGRSTERIMSRFTPFQNEAWFRAVSYDAVAPQNALPSSCDFIIHGAGNASPEKIVKEPVETMVSNFWGLRNLLDHACRQKAHRLLFISSSEVYGKKAGILPYQEREY